MQSLNFGYERARMRLPPVPPRHYLDHDHASSLREIRIDWRRDGRGNPCDRADPYTRCAAGSSVRARSQQGRGVSGSFWRAQGLLRAWRDAGRCRHRCRDHCDPERPAPRLRDRGCQGKKARDCRETARNHCRTRPGDHQRLSQRGGRAVRDLSDALWRRDAGAEEGHSVRRARPYHSRQCDRQRIPGSGILLPRLLARHARVRRRRLSDDTDHPTCWT